MPDDYLEYAPADTVAVCTRCLRVHPAESSDPDGDLPAVSDALPADPAAALGVALVADRLDAVATERPALSALVDRLEADGVDPALTIERLSDDPDLSPPVDLARRYGQFEGLRE